MATHRRSGRRPNRRRTGPRPPTGRDSDGNRRAMGAAQRVGDRNGSEGARRLLVVDDEESAETWRRSLPRSIAVQSAYTLVHAIAALDESAWRRRPFHAVVVDPEVPGGFGHGALVAALRRRPTPSTAVVSRIVAPALSLDLQCHGVLVAEKPLTTGARRTLGLHLVQSARLELRDAVAGLSVFCDICGPDLSVALRSFQQLHRITDRELDVVRGVACGLNVKQNAKFLGISESTVKSRLASVFFKCGVGTQRDLRIEVLGR